MKRSNVLIISLAALVLAASGYTYLSYGEGTLIVELTDPPSGWGQATNIYIKYGKVSVHRAEAGNESGWFTAVDNEGWVDLSTTLNSSKTLGMSSLQAGKYNLVRFEILETIITVDELNYTSTVESGKLNIAIIRGGVQIHAGQTTSLLIDIMPKVVGSVKSGFKLVPAAQAQQIS